MRSKEFAKRVEILRPRLFGFALSLLKDPEEAEDAVQDSLLKLWYIRDRLHKYKSFEGVTFVVLRNIALNKIRDKEKTISLAEVQENFNFSGYHEDGLEDEIMEALNSLPTVEQAVMRMRHIEDMETEEMAKLIGSTPGAIRVALSRARRKLRERFISKT